MTMQTLQLTEDLRLTVSKPEAGEAFWDLGKLISCQSRGRRLWCTIRHSATGLLCEGWVRKSIWLTEGEEAVYSFAIPTYGKLQLADGCNRSAERFSFPELNYGRQRADYLAATQRTESALATGKPKVSFVSRRPSIVQ
ncbi:hypothetical protein WDZ92_04565 [Nostoc sp. NIES-2111]